MSNTNNNYFTITPSEMIDLFLNMYKGDFTKQPTKMLWGQPGVGKSQAVKQFAKELGKVTGKEVEVHLVSLLLMNPIDLRGIPSKSIDENGVEVTKWLRPEIFQMDDNENKIHILFLDEISAAIPSVQAAAYQIALDKRIGEFKLPKNCFVICAGNRVTDRAVAYTMPKPLANRMTHFEVIAYLPDWKKWAYKHSIEPLIIGYLDSQPDDLNDFNSNNDDVAFATPRSWEMVDTYCKTMNLTNLLQEVEVDKKNSNSLAHRQMNTLFKLIAGSVGMGISLKFRNYLKVYRFLPKFEDIASGKITSIDKKFVDRLDILHALSAMIASNITEYSKGEPGHWTKKDNCTQADLFLTNVGIYINSLPNVEFKAWVMQDIFNNVNPDFKHLIQDNSVFDASFETVAQFI